MFALGTSYWFKSKAQQYFPPNTSWGCLQNAKEDEKSVAGRLCRDYLHCTVRGDRGFFSSSFLPVWCYAAAPTSGLCNGIQNSDKWLLLQCIGSSLWLCLCPWHLLLETGVHYGLTYNGRVLKHLGHSFSPGRLAKHLDKFYAADILQLGWAVLLPADVYLILCLRLRHSPICCTKHVWLSNLRVTPVLTYASGFVTWI